ncbi:MAG: tandem-95 repeat protein, partial [Gemmataceae bacterium]|nr:tandem-95 repeat protein [Gemmataceae bacterium]
AAVRVFSGATGGLLAPPRGEYAPFGLATTGVHLAASNDPPVVTVEWVADAVEPATNGGAPVAVGKFRVNVDWGTTPPNYGFSVNFTQTGTAAAGKDYLQPGYAIAIPPGLTVAEQTITPHWDGVAEGAETVVLTLTGGTGYQVGAANAATLRITDTATSPPPPPTSPPPPTGSIGDFVWYDTNGNGVVDGSETVAPGVNVTLSGPATRTATTDASGAYLFSGLPAGTYTVAFSPQPGYAFSTPAGGSKTVVLAAGAAVTTADAGLVPTGSVGNRVWRDQNGNGLQDAGEPGVSAATVNLYSYRTQTFRSVATATDGSYQFTGLDPTDRYALQFALPAGLQFTAAWAGADTTPGAPAPRSEADSDADPATSWTAPFAVAPGEARTDLDAGAVPIPTSGAGVVAGIVWRDLDADGVREANEPGLDRVAVHVTDPTGDTLYALVYTGPTGGYSFPSVGLVPVRVRVAAPNPLTLMDQGSDAVDSDFGQADAMTAAFTPTAGATAYRDAGVKPAPTGAVVGDRVWADWDGDGLQDAAEPGLPGATVTLRNAGTGAVVGTRTTDGSGYYQFAAPPAGDYQAVFALPGGYQFTRPGVGSNPAADSDPDPIGSTSPRFTVASGVSRPDIDAGAVKTDGAAGTVAGLVWDDASEIYGLRGTGEQGLAGVGVDLLNGSGAVVASTVTGASGGYSFPNRTPGSYRVRVQPPRPLSPMDYGSNANDGTDSDFDPATNTTVAFSLAAGTTLIRDAGVQPLIAADDDESAIAGLPATIYPLSNDSNAAGITSVGPPAHGSAIADEYGTITYTPAVGYSGADSFPYTVTDGQGSFATATVRVDISVESNPLVARDDGPYATRPGVTLSIAGPGVMANDTDPSLTATAVLAGGPSNGTVSLGSAGGFTYTPNGKYVGLDTFTYQVRDSVGKMSAPATVLVVVDDAPPVAVPDFFGTGQGQTLSVAADAGLLKNDFDADADPLTVAWVGSVSPAGAGTVSVAGDGSFAFSPAPGFTGNAAFDYQATDGFMVSDKGAVTVSVVGGLPVANADVFDTGSDATLTITAAGVLANDFRPAGGASLTASLKTGPSHGTLSLSPDGGLVYTPAAGFSGTDSFSYWAKSGALTSAVAADVQINVVKITLAVQGGDAGKGFVPINGNNDNGSELVNTPAIPKSVGIPTKRDYESNKKLTQDDPELKRVDVTVAPAQPFGVFVLKVTRAGTGQVRLWTDAKKSAPLGNKKSDPQGNGEETILFAPGKLPSTFYVEGVEMTSAGKNAQGNPQAVPDIQMTLTYFSVPLGNAWPPVVGSGLAQGVVDLVVTPVILRLEVKPGQTQVVNQTERGTNKPYSVGMDTGGLTYTDKVQNKDIQVGALHTATLMYRNMPGGVGNAGTTGPRLVQVMGYSGNKDMAGKEAFENGPNGNGNAATFTVLDKQGQPVLDEQGQPELVTANGQFVVDNGWFLRPGGDRQVSQILPRMPARFPDKIKQMIDTGVEPFRHPQSPEPKSPDYQGLRDRTAVAADSLVTLSGYDKPGFWYPADRYTDIIPTMKGFQSFALRFNLRVYLTWRYPGVGGGPDILLPLGYTNWTVYFRANRDPQTGLLVRDPNSLVTADKGFVVSHEDPKVLAAPDFNLHFYVRKN